MTIADMYALLLQRARVLRQNDPAAFEGRAYWQRIKESLQGIAFDVSTAACWIPLPGDFLEHIKTTYVDHERDPDTLCLIERAHFPAQIYHITQGCAVSPAKLLQLALNVGQHEAMTDGSDAFLESRISSLRLDTAYGFLSDADVEKIDSALTPDDFRAVRAAIISFPESA